MSNKYTKIFIFFYPYYSRQQMGNGDQCFMKMALNGVKTSCREQMAERTLLVYDRRIDKIRMKSYNISVCCSCHITTDL